MSEGLGFKSFLHLPDTESWAILSSAIKVSFLIGKMGIRISAPGESFSEIICGRCMTQCLAHGLHSVHVFLISLLSHFVSVSTVRPAGLYGGGPSPYRVCMTSLKALPGGGGGARAMGGLFCR